MLKSLVLVALAAVTVHSQDFGISTSYLFKLTPLFRVEGTHLNVAGSVYLLGWDNNRHTIRATIAYFVGSNSSSDRSVVAFNGGELSLESRIRPVISTKMFATIQVGRQMRRARTENFSGVLVSDSFSWLMSIGVGYPAIRNLHITAKYSASATEQGIRVGLEHDF